MTQNRSQPDPAQPNQPGAQPEPTRPIAQPTVQPGTQRGRSYFPLRDHSFMATTVIAPIVVAAVAAAVGLGFTGGFSWVADMVKGEDPPIYVSGSRSPRTVESPRASPSPGNVSAVEGPGTGTSSASVAPSTSTDSVSPETAQAEGLNATRTQAYLCPWDVWVVKTRPSALVDPPVSGREVDSALVSYQSAGDPDETALYLSIQPQGSRPLVVKEVRIKVVERNPVPAPDEATVLGLLTAGCGGDPASV